MQSCMHLRHSKPIFLPLRHSIIWFQPLTTPKQSSWPCRVFGIHNNMCEAGLIQAGLVLCKRPGENERGQGQVFRKCAKQQVPGAVSRFLGRNCQLKGTQLTSEVHVPLVQCHSVSLSHLLSSGILVYLPSYFTGKMREPSGGNMSHW